MADQHRSFTVSASVSQRLALLSLMSVCASVLVILCRFDNLIFTVVNLLLLCWVIFFAIRQMILLNDWSLSFLLTMQGEGRWVTGVSFNVLPRTVITPFVCLIYLQQDTQTRLLFIWRDMLTDEQYRHLCRLLLLSKVSQANMSDAC